MRSKANFIGRSKCPHRVNTTDAHLGCAVMLMIGLSLVASTGSTRSTGGEQSVTYHFAESAPSKELAELVSKLFATSTEIHISYTPLTQMGRISLEHEDELRIHWRYRFSMRCGKSTYCRNAMKNLRSTFITSRLIKETCSGVVSALVEFKNEQSLIGSIVIKDSGYCFSTNGKSYAVSVSGGLEGPMRNAVAAL